MESIAHRDIGPTNVQTATPVEPPSHKKLKTVDIPTLQSKLCEVGIQLNECMQNIGKCGTNGDDSDDDIGDANSPWSVHVMKLANKIDRLQRERFDIARELKTHNIEVESLDDGY